VEAVVIGAARRRFHLTGRRPWLPAAAGLAVLLGGAGRAWACPSCFGDAQGPLIDGARLGIWLLLGVTVCLQVGFAAFFLHLRRRAAKAADQAPVEDCRDLRGERTSARKEDMR
jgi:hypothetical protein